MIDRSRLLPATAILFLFIFFATTVQARDIIVDSSCTLRDAISAANGGRTVGGCRGGSGADAIYLTRDISLNRGLPAITSSVAIIGDGYTISGNGRYQIFAVASRGHLTIDNVRLVDGRGAEDGGYNRGGAVLNRGELTIFNSSFMRNSATFGGAIHNAQGRVTISNSLFSGNTASQRGGTIRNHSLQELYVDNSLFERNAADWGGAIHSHGETHISHSSFFDNRARATADESGGGLYVSGFHDNNLKYFRGRLFMYDSALSGNRGGDCLVYPRYGELIESEANYVEDGGCWARWSGYYSDNCPPGPSDTGECLIGTRGDSGSRRGGASQKASASKSSSPRVDSLAFGDAVEGSLNKRNPDAYYAFEAWSGDAVTISMRAISGNLDPYLELYDRKGARLANDDDSGGGLDAQISDFYIDRQDIYLIRVRSYDGSTAGGYRLRLDLGYASGPPTAVPARFRGCDLAPRLSPGDLAVLSPGEPNRVRAAAGLHGRALRQIEAGDQVSVLEGPVCADGYIWYRVNTPYHTGWTAEGDAGEYWLIPISSGSSSSGRTGGASSSGGRTGGSSSSDGGSSGSSSWQDDVKDTLDDIYPKDGDFVDRVISKAVDRGLQAGFDGDSDFDPVEETFEIIGETIGESLSNLFGND